MIEVDGHPVTFNLADHTRQFCTLSVGERHHQPRCNRHIHRKIPALHFLYVLRVGLAKGFFGRHFERLMVTHRQPQQKLFKTGQHVAIAQCEFGRFTVKRRIHLFTVFNGERKMQHDAAARKNACRTHNCYLINSK